MSLVELALDLASRTLKKDDVFLAKVFQGKGFVPTWNNRESSLKPLLQESRMPHGQDPEKFIFSQKDLKANPGRMVEPIGV